MIWRPLLALSLAMIVGGCSDRKPRFSHSQFLAAKSRCGAKDAYIVKAAPNTIAFRGESGDQVAQAACLKKNLAGTDVETVVLGSALYQQR